MPEASKKKPKPDQTGHSTSSTHPPQPTAPSDGNGKSTGKQQQQQEASPWTGLPKAETGSAVASGLNESVPQASTGSSAAGGTNQNATHNANAKPTSKASSKSKASKKSSSSSGSTSKKPHSANPTGPLPKATTGSNVAPSVCPFEPVPESFGSSSSSSPAQLTKPPVASTSNPAKPPVAQQSKSEPNPFTPIAGSLGLPKKNQSTAKDKNKKKSK